MLWISRLNNFSQPYLRGNQPPRIFTVFFLNDHLFSCWPLKHHLNEQRCNLALLYMSARSPKWESVFCARPLHDWRGVVDELKRVQRRAVKMIKGTESIDWWGEKLRVCLAWLNRDYWEISKSPSETAWRVKEKQQKLRGWSKQGKWRLMRLNWANEKNRLNIKEGWLA